MKQHLADKAATVEPGRARRGTVPAPSETQPGATRHPILQLQGTIGNQAVNRLLQSGTFQTKLTVGRSGDTPVQRQESDEEERLQGKFPQEKVPMGRRNHPDDALHKKPGAPAAPPAQHPNRTGLPDHLKSGIESLSGFSMDNVNVHYNSSQPARLNALAYTQGTEIHVASGQEQHLPHEAWHVVQQAQGRVQPTMQLKDGVPVNDDAGLEQEADVMGAKALQMRRAEKRALECPTHNIAQMKEPRSKNPHNPQTGVTSHHIVPHELLGKILDKFSGKGEKEEITGLFLPDFSSLTLANFVAQVAVGVIYDGVSPDKVIDLPAEVAFKPFGTLSEDEKSKARFKVEDAGNVSLEELQVMYEQLKAGANVQNNAGEAVSGLRDLGDSFFEWQSGNLFYGPERIEPGAKDGFDYDARLIYGEPFVVKLEAIYKELRNLQAKDDEPSKVLMKQTLKRMAALTVGVGVPRFDASLWLPIDSAAKKSVHDTLLPTRNLTSKQGASIHCKVLSSAIRDYCNNKTRVHQLHSFTRGHVEDISGEIIFDATRKALWVKVAHELTVPMSSMKTIDDFKGNMEMLLKQLFGLK